MAIGPADDCLIRQNPIADKILYVQATIVSKPPNAQVLRDGPIRGHGFLAATPASATRFRIVAIQKECAAILARSLITRKFARR